MGKASKFFKLLLGFKTNDTPTSRSQPKKQLKRRWSLMISRRGNPCGATNSNSLEITSIYERRHNVNENEDSNKHAIALAALDAAVTAAQAAAEVVRMTSRTNGYRVRRDLAAIQIQSCFRAYLARRALRALKALVKLQAVVRGHILRKQTADMMRRLQALIRAQARARALRSQISDLTTKPTSHLHHHHGPPTPEKVEHFPRTKHDHRSISKRHGSKSYARGITSKERSFLDGSSDQENDKIVEVDTVEHHVMTKGRKHFQPEHINFAYSQSMTTSRGSTFQPTISSPCASCEVNSYQDSLRGGVFTPVQSDGPSSCISRYSDHPSYMANTESSRAKVRSLSAPRLRPQPEISNATKRNLGHKYVSNMQKVPTVRESFTKKAYPGSCRLDRLGMPVYDAEENSGNGELNDPTITTMPSPSPTPKPNHPPPTPPPVPPTSGLIRSSYKKGKQTKVFRVVRSVFRSFPIMSQSSCKIILPSGRLPDSHRGTKCVTGTLYGYRNGRVTLAIQENPKAIPIMTLELELKTNDLQKEMNLGMVRIALECEKQSDKDKVKLLEEPLWTMFFNGKKGGLGVKRDATDDDLNIIELLRPASMAAGVLPGKSDVEGPDGEIAYMRAHFDRVVGSKDSETLYMLSPDCNNGPELSIFFVRI